MKLLAIVPILALLVACAPSAATHVGAALAAATPAAAEAPSRVVPLVDHHQHLFSPAAAALVNGPAPLPAVQLPPELASLLRAREAGWNDSTTLARLYADDAALFTGDSAGWIRGRDVIAAKLSRNFTGPYRLVPVGFRSEGSAAAVWGYLLEGDATAQRFGFFQLDLQKGADGAFRVVAETPVYSVPEVQAPITAERLITLLDEAGIRRAVVLSEAFWFDSPLLTVEDRHAKVRAENDWTAAEVAKYPDRLIAFCSFNPLADYAVTELDRCAASGRFKGLKLSFAMSRVDLKNPDHVARVRRVFEAANRHRFAIVVHARGDGEYGREHARVFLDQLAAAAADVPIQIAHLWGGEGFSDAALAVYADAVKEGHPATHNLYFDVAEIARTAAGSPEAAAIMARRIRQIGLGRVLYGSDAALNGRATPRQGWAQFRLEVPLTDGEQRAIAGNVAPYMR